MKIGFAAAVSLLSLGSLFGKKLLQDRFAIRLQDSAEDSGSVVQSRVVCDLEQRMAGSGFGIGCAVDHGGNSSQHNCSRAHRAGFQSDVDRAVQ